MAEGTVFEITPAGELSTLVSFDGTNGIYPEAALVQGSDGNFYGTTPDTLVGGAFGGGGTIFRLIQPLSLRIALGFRGASVQLSWNSSSNRLYQVQYVNDLSTTNWLNYGPILYATGPVTALDVPTFGLQQRYFRVALLP